MADNKCICCGEIIPEGMIACPHCLVVSKKKTELKPCPFCGGKARRYEGKHDGYGVCCTKCSVKVYGYFSKAGATRAWNRRAEDG